MAHSIQKYGNKTAIINDLDLLVIIGLAIDVIHQRPSFVELKSLATQWRESMLQYGPGVIDLKLEQLITTLERLKEFRALLSAIDERASKHDGSIPAQVLDDLVSAPGVVLFGDYSVSHVKEAVKKLEELLV